MAFGIPSSAASRGNNAARLYTLQRIDIVRRKKRYTVFRVSVPSEFVRQDGRDPGTLALAIAQVGPREKVKVEGPCLVLRLVEAHNEGDESK